MTLNSQRPLKMHETSNNAQKVNKKKITHIHTVRKHKKVMNNIYMAELTIRTFTSAYFQVKIDILKKK